MKFIYTGHAKSRISQRGLSKKQIESTVANPDYIIPSFRGRAVSRKDFGDKTLEVVYKKLNAKVIIITSYWFKEA